MMEELQLNTPVEVPADRTAMAEQWASYVIERWLKALDKFGIGFTHDLQNSFEKQLKLHDGDVEAVIFKFLRYGRFVDMGVGRGQSLNDLVTNRKFDRYRDSSGKMTGGGKRVKKPWYSKVIYSQVAKLAELYQNDYSAKYVQLIENSLTGSLTLPL